MSFEIRDRDLLARIGKLETKSGIIETPLLFPVINPSIQPISPSALQELFRCTSVITNAYIIKMHFQDTAVQQGIHSLLGFSKAIMTDSGAYQILTYGDVKTTAREIVEYQEAINTDIATILDIPTGWMVSEDHARWTVQETLRRAKDLVDTKKRDDILWVGPVQGGSYTDLVVQSAQKMGKLPFEIHAIGSPTPVLEQYRFDTLVDMILAAKANLPLDRPLHLFGAGHPFMFALAVALGCDLFDSAAYAIYARSNRYMTEQGTKRLDELRYFPCSCPTCVRSNPQDIMVLPMAAREKALAMHNLYVSFSEISRIKQAIIEGRLWEHLELRARGHPALLKALKSLKKHRLFFEKNSPVTKTSGLFSLSSLGLTRPEVTRHRKRISERYSPPKEGKILLLLPQTTRKPFHKSKAHQKILKQLHHKLGSEIDKTHVCTYAAPFGVVPAEIDQVYHLSQHETVTPLSIESIDYVAEQVAEYISTTEYEMVILFQDVETWKMKITEACKKACRERRIHMETYTQEKGELWALGRLADYTENHNK
ncbi:MAG: tRNA guanosine(15) transglycosylase TgtA [Candidatus Bathyarchaeota archaeon]|nr:MAG: tRNA guanosine(15) transglycosylase TgtA [Candidatus Bathyarchaeota archaeon]